MEAGESDLLQEDEVIIQDCSNKKKILAEEIADDSIDIIEYVEESLNNCHGKVSRQILTLSRETNKSGVEADHFIGAASAFSDFIVFPNCNAIWDLAL